MSGLCALESNVRSWNVLILYLENHFLLIYFFILDFIVNRYSRLFSNLCLYCNTSIAIREESAHIIEAMNFISLSSLI